MKRWAMATVVMAFAGWLACGGGDDGDGGGNGQGNVGEEVSQVVTAADGGELATVGGDALVTIPAGALAEDTEISIKVLDSEGLPNEDNLAGSVYEFGPDGTEFLKPVTIALELTGEAPEGKKAVLAFLEGDTWEEVAGSSESGDLVSGDVTHFSKFVILFVDGQAVLVSDDELCQDLSFSACGGAVVGVWEVEALCMGDIPLGEDPFKDHPECSDTTQFNIYWDWIGTVEMASDGSFSQDLAMKVTYDIIFYDACLTAVSDGEATPETLCQDVNEQQDFGVCEYGSGQCNCTGEAQQTEIKGEGTYSVDGSTLSITADGSTSDSLFCVDGDSLTVESDMGGVTGYTIAKRQ